MKNLYDFFIIGCLSGVQLLLQLSLVFEATARRPLEQNAGGGRSWFEPSARSMHRRALHNCINSHRPSRVAVSSSLSGEYALNECTTIVHNNTFGCRRQHRGYARLSLPSPSSLVPTYNTIQQYDPHSLWGIAAGSTFQTCAFSSSDGSTSGDLNEVCVACC